MQPAPAVLLQKNGVAGNKPCNNPAKQLPLVNEVARWVKRNLQRAGVKEDTFRLIFI